MDEWLRSGLADADPGRDGVGNDASGLVREMTHRAEAHAAEGPNSRGRWWKRRRFAVPLGVAGVAVQGGLFGSTAIVEIRAAARRYVAGLVAIP